jgi:hypothetical protein
VGIMVDARRAGAMRDAISESPEIRECSTHQDGRCDRELRTARKHLGWPKVCMSGGGG